MSSFDVSTIEVRFTESELKNLNRLFGIVGEEALKANWFTKADIEDIYSIIGHVRTAIDELEQEQPHL